MAVLASTPVDQALDRREITVLGETVRAYRQRRGMSQEELAAAASLSVRGIRKIEAGDTDTPRPSTVRLLADALKLTGDERDHFFAAAAGEPTGPDRTVPRQLPADLRGFTGRAAQLDELDAMLPGNGSRPPAVVISAIGGTAGVGKTALAVHWAHRVADLFPDGQLYANLRGFDPSNRVVPPAEAMRGFLDALGVPADRIPADLDAQAALFRSTLAGRRILLLLDNARDAEQVRPLLPGTPTTLVLVTSRNQLTSLVATEGARPLNLNLLSTQEARELLAGRLGAHRVAAEPDVVEAIINACSRLPLALAIAAARAAHTGYPLATLATELHDAGNRLDTLDAGDPTTQVRAVISWSYRTLSPSASGLFRLLGLHPGPDISVAAAASLAGCPPARAGVLLTELVRANLITEHAPGRYARHDLLQTYAAERAEVDESEAGRHAALTRLLDHYAQTAYAADRFLNPLREPIAVPLGQPAAGTAIANIVDYEQAMDWLTIEYPVLMAALRLAASAGFDARTWHLAWCLDTYLNRRGYRHDQATAWQTAVQAARRLDDPAAQALAHRLLANADVSLGRYRDAHRGFRRAIELYARVGDQAGEANTHRNLSLLWDKQDRPRLALDHGMEALTLFRNVGDQVGVARTLNNLGWCHARLGDYAQAVNNCEQAVVLLQQLDDQAGAAATWDSLGYAHHHLGNHAQAADCYRRALVLYQQLGGSYDQAETLIHLGEAHRAAGEAEAAGDAWLQALDILTELDHPDADDVRSKLDTLHAPS